MRSVRQVVSGIYMAICVGFRSLPSDAGSLVCVVMGVGGELSK